MLEIITNIGELQTKIMYSIIVAGKSAKFANAVVGQWLLKCVRPNELTFDAVRRHRKNGTLEGRFRAIKAGNYTKLVGAMSALVDSNIDLTTCAPQDLEAIKGIGPKTSRFFIVWTRPEEKYAVLDVHILRWLKSLGYDVPNSTPQSAKKYAQIEQWFLSEAAKAKKTPRELDYEIWIAGSKTENKIVCGQAIK